MQESVIDWKLHQLLTGDSMGRSKPIMLGAEDYEVPQRVTEDEFRRQLRSYLDDNQITTLGDDVIGDLFQITSEGTREYGIVAKLRSPQAQKDWKTRGRLVKQLTRACFIN